MDCGTRYLIDSGIVFWIFFIAGDEVEIPFSRDFGLRPRFFGGGAGTFGSAGAGGGGGFSLLYFPVLLYARLILTKIE